MSILRTLIATASRGGLKVGFILLTISLFTGLVVAVQVTARSYATEASILKEISLNPKMGVHKEPRRDALRVGVTALRLMDRTVMVFAVEDPGQFLNLHGAKLEGFKPMRGEAIIGVRLKPLTRNSSLPIMGHTLRVSGYIPSPNHLSSAIILTPETLGMLGLESSTLYYERPVMESGVRLTEAPSSKALVEGVKEEALSSLNLITLLPISMLTLTCMVQGYNTAHESRRVLRVFTTLGAPDRSMVVSLILLALLLSLVGVAVGFSLGMVSSALASSLLSLVLGLPYIKPVAGPESLPWMGYILAATLTSLSIGLLRGYSIDMGQGS